MSRPNFLTAPGTWVRAPRIDQTPADYASAITVYQAVGSVQRAILAWLAAVCAAVLAFHLLLRWLP